MILLSGFEPFDNYPTNPSQEIALSLANENIHSIILPVSFEHCFETLNKKIQELKPEAVICLGLADIRKKVSVERVAINIINARIADNQGLQPTERKIQEDGDDGIFTSLPLEEILEQVPAVEISNTAGAYVCNYLMYQLLYHYKESFPCGFIHVPATPQMLPDGPCQSLTKSASDIKNIIEILLR